MVELIETVQFKVLEAVHKVQTLETLNRLRGDKRGVTAMEYGLIAACVGIAAIVGMKTLGTGLSDKFNSIANTLKTP